MHKLPATSFNENKQKCGTGMSGDPEVEVSVQSVVPLKQLIYKKNLDFPFCLANAASDYKKSVDGGGQSVA